MSYRNLPQFTLQFQLEHLEEVGLKRYTHLLNLDNGSNNHPTCFVHWRLEDQWKSINELYESSRKQVHT